MLLYVHTETISFIRDGEPRTVTSTFTQLLNSEEFEFNVARFTSTETIQTIRDGEPRTVTSTFTQLLNSGDGVPLVELMYLVFTRMPGESYRRRLRSLLLSLRDVFRALINSLAC